MREVEATTDRTTDRVGIIFAVPHEMGSVLGRMRDARRVPIDGITAHEGWLGKAAVVVAAVGMGGAARKKAGNLLEGGPSLSRLWVAGYGGALDPALAIGDVIISPRLPSGFEPPALAEGRRVFAGKILQVGDVITDPLEKARLFRESGALCCDMESGIVGRLAEERGMPCGSVRAISDTAVQRLPQELLKAAWDGGAQKPTPVRLLLRMVAHPLCAIDFIRFVVGLGTARENLGRVLERLVVDARPH